TVDPVLFVYDSTGKNFLGFNDDRAPGDVQSEVAFYASAGQSYKLVVGGYSGNSTGNYQISVNPYLFIFPFTKLTTSALPSAITDLGSGTGASGAGVSSGASSDGTAPVDRTFAELVQADGRRLMPGNTLVLRQGDLSEAASRLRAARLPNPRSDAPLD